MNDNSSNPLIDTYYGKISQNILNIASNVRLLICDVDGVMSDGMIYLGNNGEEFKVFNVKDGYGIRCLLTSGIEVAIISGRSSKLTENRCQSLGIIHLYQGQLDKTLALNDLLNKLNLKTKQVAYIGDDLIDFSVMEKVGLSIAVEDAHPLLKNRADYITHLTGGHGAVREVCDILLLAHGKLLLNI